MDIMISENLRELRKKRGNTQEELADFLTVSPQAVSKWERGDGLPDISILPRIAAYYDVSLDELFGVDEVRKQEKIREYQEKSSELRRIGKIDECIAIWRNACKEFPNDYECLYGLMNALHFWGSDDKGDETIEEIVSIAERLLKESTVNYHRHSATQLLVLNLPALGRDDEARKYAEDAPSVYVTNNVLLSDLDVADGKAEGKQGAFNNITTYLELISNELYNLCCYDRGNYERYIYLHELFLKFWNLVFDDGFYGFYNVRIRNRHYWLAKLYTNIRNDEEKAREHIEAAAKCAIEFDNLPEEFVHKATLFGDGWEYSMKNTSRNYTKSNARILLTDIDGSGLMDASFDRYRDKEWFKAIIEKLEAAK